MNAVSAAKVSTLADRKIWGSSFERQDGALIFTRGWLFAAMAGLSRQALNDAFQAIAQVGGSTDKDPELLEEALMTTRNRVRASGKIETLAGQKGAMGRCLGPLHAWVEGEHDLRGLPIDLKSDLVWNLYTSCISRTQGADAFFHWLLKTKMCGTA